MSIDAIALLRGREIRLPAGTFNRVLDDGVLVFTLFRFGGDADYMAYCLRSVLGEALDGHRDARGVFLFPDVAEPRVATYEGVINEIGRAGVWVPVVQPSFVPPSLAQAPEGSFESAMGELLGALSGDKMADFRQAVASGDPASLAAAQAKLVEALGGEEKASALGARLADTSAQVLRAAQVEWESRMQRIRAVFAGTTELGDLQDVVARVRSNWNPEDLRRLPDLFKPVQTDEEPSGTDKDR